MSLTFITGVKFYKSTLDMLNHVTYIYDPNWNPDNSTKATFPVSFFHVKNQQEIMASEVSQKPMLFYNSNSPSDASTVNAGLLNVVADNIVIKPKSYKLDIIVPYQDLSLLNQSFIFNTETLQAVNSTILNTVDNLRNFSSIVTLKNPILDFYRNLLSTLLIQDNKAGMGLDFINNVINQPEYNKDSLELMWKLRRILKIKMWNSWEYEYVSITDLTITKEGTEDGVYEATMTVQEMPIISLYSYNKVKSKNLFARKNTAIKFQGEKAIKLLDFAEIKY